MEELIKVLKTLLPKLQPMQLKGIITMLGLNDYTVTTSKDEGADASVKSITVAEIAASLRSLGYSVQLPGLDAAAALKSLGDNSGHLPYEAQEPEEDVEEAAHNKALNAVYLSRFGDMDAATKAIMTDIMGPDYSAQLYQQEVAFAKYVRGGERRLSSNEARLLDTQIFPIKSIMSAVIDGGLDVRTLKATQVESQGELGGVAVPSNRQSAIETRLPGLTAIRGNGANVITLINSNSTEIPQWTTDDTTDQRYIGMLRGERGKETADPNAKNWKMELVPLIAYLYTFKIALSQSLVEDAANVVTMLMNDIAITIAMDEDEEFVIGDGVAKSEGILPGGLNEHSLTEVKSGAAATLTTAGIKSLKRGLRTQYRKGGIFIGNSDTFGVIEGLTAGAGTSNWAFPDLSETGVLLSQKVAETEVMQDVGANKFPLLFGDPRGYDIVERLGMTIQRFQDSGTGINKVEYHVRKRFGGKLEKPWMWSVQKCST